MNAGYHLADVEGLGDVIVGANLQTHHLVRDVISGGQHQHGNIRFSSQLAADVKALDVGQHEIQHHGVGPALASKTQRLGPIAGSYDAEPIAFQVGTDDPPDVRLVVDNQDQPGTCHGGFCRPAVVTPSTFDSYTRP